MQPVRWEPEPHPLDAARLRHERSRKCLTDVETALDNFAAMHERGNSVHGNALAYQDADTGTWIPLPWYGIPPLEITFSTSEMIYNLKVALDYVSYALFKQALAKGRIGPSDFKTQQEFVRFEKAVQFPIMDSPQKFSTWTTKNRQWIGGEGTVFERAQPYRRAFMRFLGDSYHNLDKHRDLQPLVVDVDLSHATFRDTQATTQGGYFQTEGVPAGRPVAVYVRGSVEVFLDGRTPLIETLKMLEREVSALVNAFALAFK